MRTFRSAATILAAVMGCVSGCGGAGDHMGTAGTGGSGSGGTSGSAGSPGSGGSTGGGGTYDFPSSAIMYQDISNANVDSQSTAIIGNLQNIGWDSGQKLGIDPSFSVLVADPSVKPRAFAQSSDVSGDNDCDTAPIPLPPGGHIEGNTGYSCADGGDCHLLVYQGSRLYELYAADVTGGSATGGTFSGACLAVWDLTRDYWQEGANPYSRGDYCNGSDAGDLPLATLLLKADEIKAGHVDHALRFTLPNPNILATFYVHPATHIGLPTGQGDYPPYGSRFRLRKDFDLTTLPSDEARTVARALQTYGMFLADGGNIYISATDDVGDVLKSNSLQALQPQDFEIVEGGTRYSWPHHDCMHTPITQ